MADQLTVAEERALAYLRVMNLLMKVTINCQRPQGRFGEDECQVCPACRLVEMKRAYKVQLNAQGQEAGKTLLIDGSIA